MTEPSDDSIAIPRGGVSWVYASGLSFVVAGALFYLFLARVLPIGELGEVVILQAFAFIVATGATLGLGPAFQHFLSYYRGRGETSMTRTLLGMSYAVTALLGFAAVAIALGLSRDLSFLLFHSSQYTSTVELLSVFAGLLVAEMIFPSVLLGLQRYVAYAGVNLLASITLYGFPLACYVVSPSVRAVVLGWIAGGIVQTVVAVAIIQRLTRTVRSTRERPSLARIALYRTVFAYSIPVVASLLITTSAYYIDRLILASIANLPTVGVYNYALLFSSAVLAIVTPIASIIVPRISALFGRGESTNIRAVVRNSNTLAILALVPLALGVAVLGPPLLHYLVGIAFVPAAFPMAVLLVIMALSVPFANLYSLAIATRRTSVVMVSSACALLANAALCIALVPHLGMLGAALGNSATYWAPFLVLYLALRSSGLVAFDLRSIALIWSASALGALAIGVPLAVLNYAPLFVPVFLAIGVLIFLVSLRLLRAIPGEAADELHRHLPHWASPLRPLICWAAACDHCRHREKGKGSFPPLAPKDGSPADP